eukprot:g28040.t1
MSSEVVKRQMLHHLWLYGKVPWRMGVVLVTVEGMIPANSRQGESGEEVFGGGIPLELSEMVEDDPLNAEVGGMKSEDKRSLITL